LLTLTFAYFTSVLGLKVVPEMIACADSVAIVVVGVVVVVVVLNCLPFLCPNL
jgi:hypothetical protein